MAILSVIHHLQRKLKLKFSVSGKPMERHFINLHSDGVTGILIIKNINELRKDIDKDPIIETL